MCACWFLVYTFKPHFITILVLSVPMWMLSQAMSAFCMAQTSCAFVMTMFFQAIFIWVVHECLILVRLTRLSGLATTGCVCGLLVYNFKSHLIPFQAFSAIFMPQSSLAFVMTLLLQAIFILIVHECLILLRPSARDRNLVGQGFADPAYPGTLKPFPSLEDAPGVQLSVIIPACSEVAWLQGEITKVLRTLQARALGRRSAFTFEVILVVSHTSSNAYDIALRQVAAFGLERVRALRVSRALLPGRALREGALRAR